MVGTYTFFFSTSIMINKYEINQDENLYQIPILIYSWLSNNGIKVLGRLIPMLA